MLLVPHILGSRIADWTEQATRSHAVYDTPKECTNIHADIHRCNALVQFYEFARFRICQVQSVINAVMF